MSRIILILVAIFFIAPLFAAGENDDKISLYELVNEMSQVKASCFAEWSDWRNVDKEKLAAFQKAVSDSTIFASNPEIRHNMLVLVNGLVSAQEQFEKNAAEYQEMLGQEFTPAQLRNKSSEAFRAGRLRAIKSKWSQIQADHSAAIQVQLNAMQRLSTATQEKTILRSDPLFTAATALEDSNIAHKNHADIMANATELHFVIVEVKPDGVLAHPRDEDEKIRGRTVYSKSFIFVTGVDAPMKGRKVVCTAESDGTIQHPNATSPFEIEKWKAVDTKDEAPE